MRVVPTEEGPTPELLRAAADDWDNRLKAAALGAAVLTAALYPLVLDPLVRMLGERTLATGLALVATASASAHARRGGQWTVTLAHAAAAALAGGSALTRSLVPMMLIPAAIHAAISVLFFASLRGGLSLVERAAKMIQPVAPDFIGPYCRRVTVLWGVVMALDAVLLAALALTASAETWRAVAGGWIWGWMGAVSAVEFLVRKTYFRNYWYRGPFERVWEKLFPAEATPMGRRSAAYIRMLRELTNQPGSKGR
jgi:uncharacterized membrane protein